MDAVLFLHSTGTSPLMWAAVPGDVTKDRARLTPAHLGYPPNPALARGERAGVDEDAAHVAGAVPDDVARIDVVAHSYGGFVAARLVPRLGGRLRSLFLYEPVLFGALARDEAADPAAVRAARELAEHPWFLRDEARGGTDPWLEIFIDYWNRPGSWARMPEPLKEQTRALAWKMSQEVRSCFLAPQRFEDLAVSVPITLAMGTRSPKTSRAMAARIAAVNPQAKLVELEGAGHMAPLTHAPLVHEALRRHLEGVPA
jgi:pimeloyl-ACP methyl ester carboxylesterase